MGNAAILLDLALSLTTRLLALQQTIAAARAEGRDVSDAELAAAMAEDDAARAALQAKINAG